MMNGSSTKCAVVNHLDGRYRDMIIGDITAGLSARQRYIPSKYFYDARGSKLFEDICWLPEYYPTRTEISILKRIAPNLMPGFANRDLVELGAGANWKISILLEAAGIANRATMRYIPVDISETAVAEASRDLLKRYPELEVIGIAADIFAHLEAVPDHRAKMYCFLGGTIGNMGRGEAVEFLTALARNMREDDKLLIGFDMVKAQSALEAAYNDSQGVTRDFNKNLLNVINKELNADFDTANFAHLAFFNRTESRIEMHLEANCDCCVRVKGLEMDFEFSKGETIHTENSHKFTHEAISDMARDSRLSIEEWYSDPNDWFRLVLMGTE